MEKSMMLVKSSWQETQTFRMIPVTDACPYVECIFDPGTKVFVIISKTTKHTLHMLPKLDEYGQVITGSKGTKQDRHKIEVFQEFYIEDMELTFKINKLMLANIIHTFLLLCKINLIAYRNLKFIFKNVL
jgi:hypothetical protein